MKDGFKMDTILYELTDYKKTGVLSEEDRTKLRAAADILRDGGLVAFPTETVYGLGGNALMKDASRRIYAAKGRPSDNPLIVHITDFDEIAPLVSEYPREAEKLGRAFWPGPFTMILPKSDAVPGETTGGLSTVAVRMPSHPVARELIRLAGVPVAAPSANTSGRPSTTTAEHCVEDLWGKIEAIVDGGPCTIGVESTIVDASSGSPMLLRPGAVTREMLSEELGGSIAVDPAVERPLERDEHPKAPGMKYRHYAPKAPMIIVDRTEDSRASEGKSGFAEKELAQRMAAVIREKLDEGLRVGVISSDQVFSELRKLAPEENDSYMTVLGSMRIYELGQMVFADLGRSEDEAGWARNLFAALREMDEFRVDYIVAEGLDQRDIGFAIMNRLKKAAGGSVIYL